MRGIGKFKETMLAFKIAVELDFLCHFPDKHIYIFFLRVLFSSSHDIPFGLPVEKETLCGCTQ